MKTLIAATCLSFLLGTTAFAQAPASPAKASADEKDEKKAISKACSDQANEKDLRGKERKKFRAACIKSGGKAT